MFDCVNVSDCVNVFDVVNVFNCVNVFDCVNALDAVNVPEPVNVYVAGRHSSMTVSLAAFNPQNVSLGYEFVVMTALTVDEPNTLASNAGSVTP